MWQYLYIYISIYSLPLSLNVFILIALTIAGKSQPMTSCSLRRANSWQVKSVPPTTKPAYWYPLVFSVRSPIASERLCALNALVTYGVYWPAPIPRPLNTRDLRRPNVPFCSLDRRRPRFSCLEPRNLGCTVPGPPGNEVTTATCGSPLTTAPRSLPIGPS